MQAKLKAHIAHVVRARRKQLGLTQDQVAERIGRTTESVSNIERARSLPSVATLIALSDTLDMPLRDLFPSGPADRTINAARQRKEADTIALIRALPDNALDIAMDQIKALGRISEK